MNHSHQKVDLTQWFTATKGGPSLHMATMNSSCSNSTSLFERSCDLGWWDYLTRGGAVHSHEGSGWYHLQSLSLLGMCWSLMIHWGSLVREVSITSSVQLNLSSVQLSYTPGWSSVLVRPPLDSLFLFKQGFLPHFRQARDLCSYDCNCLSLLWIKLSLWRTICWCKTLSWWMLVL